MVFWFEPTGDRTHDLPYINYYTTYAVALIKNLNYLNLKKNLVLKQTYYHYISLDIENEINSMIVKIELNNIPYNTRQNIISVNYSVTH